MIVLNADEHKGGIDPELIARLEAASSYVVATPSGGRHFYFETELKIGNGAFAEHVDVRSAKGYVLAPPSIVDGKPYRVIAQCGMVASLPGWAVERRSEEHTSELQSR